MSLTRGPYPITGSERGTTTRRSHFGRRAFLRVLVVGSGVSLLAACTSAPPQPAPTVAPPAAQPTEAPKPAATTPPAAPKPTSAAAPVAKAGAQPKHPFVFLSFAVPTTLDPAASTDWPGRIHIIQAYEPLLRYAAGSPPRLVPHLAESVTGSDDGRTYTAKLRPGVRFHDGSELDADAVAFSMDRLLTIRKPPSNAFRDFLQPGNTKAVDKLTVQFNLTEPSGIFPSALPFFFIVNPKVILANKAASGPYAEHGDYGEQYLQSNDAGSGPYRLTSITPNAETVFEAFPEYWRGWKENQFSSYTYKLVREPATASLLMRQGQANMLYEFYAAHVFEELSSAPNLQVRADSGVKALHFLMNTRKPPLDNHKVRQAISYAFDYKTAVEGIMGNVPNTTRLRGALPKNVWGALETSPYDTDLDRARSLLAESGLKPGELTIEYVALGGPTDQRTKLGLLMQSNFAPLGITVEITQGVFADVIKRVTSPETSPHMLSSYVSMESHDPGMTLYLNYHSSQHGSWTASHWYGDKQLDELLEQGRRTTNDERRLAIYKQVQERVFDACPALFLFNEPYRTALSKDVAGYEFVVTFYNYSAYELSKQG